MNKDSANLPSESFVKDLRNALNHLYDPDFLRGSRLVTLFGIHGRFHTPSALQEILTKAIDSLKPSTRAPHKAHAQAVYDLLLYRYVQQFNQDEIANQLGISVRHLRRQQNQAVYELACKLWEQYGNDISDAEPAQPLPESIKSKTIPPIADPSDQDDITGELAWLQAPASQRFTNLENALEECQILIYPFAEQHNIHLQFPKQPGGLIEVHPVAFQQALLSLLSIAIRLSAAEQVEMQVAANAGWLALEVRAQTGVEAAVDPESIASVHRIVEISRGKLDWELAGGQFLARVGFHSLDRVNVLAIDDNAEIITLMQRFAAETRFQITGLSDPKQAVDVALKSQPDLIILDIMMPQVDGLQMLSRFKHHPGLGRVPVIICSVLPQKDLAAFMGASDFIQKPIQRDTFLSTLERAIEQHPMG